MPKRSFLELSEPSFLGSETSNEEVDCGHREAAGGKTCNHSTKGDRNSTDKITNPEHSPESRVGTELLLVVFVAAEALNALPSLEKWTQHKSWGTQDSAPTPETEQNR